MEINNSTEKKFQLVVFTVADIEYAVDILNVWEITRVIEINSTNKGEFINLRGSIVPIINLRKKFGLEVRNNNINSRIIIIDISGAIQGLIVDSVNEVFRIPYSAVHPFDPTSTIWGKKYIQGVARIDKRNILIINQEKLLQ